MSIRVSVNAVILLAGLLPLAPFPFRPDRRLPLETERNHERHSDAARRKVRTWEKEHSR
jgi:hypothetical protein